MARELRLQNRIKLVDICAGRSAGPGNCIAYRELAKLAGGYKESGGHIEIWIKMSELWLSLLNDDQAVNHENNKQLSEIRKLGEQSENIF